MEESREGNKATLFILKLSAWKNTASHWEKVRSRNCKVKLIPEKEGVKFWIYLRQENNKVFNITETLEKVKH